MIFEHVIIRMDYKSRDEVEIPFTEFYDAVGGSWDWIESVLWFGETYWGKNANYRLIEKQIMIGG